MLIFIKNKIKIVTIVVSNISRRPHKWITDWQKSHSEGLTHQVLRNKLKISVGKLSTLVHLYLIVKNISKRNKNKRKITLVILKNFVMIKKWKIINNCSKKSSKIINCISLGIVVNDELCFFKYFFTLFYLNTLIYLFNFNFFVKKLI